MEHGDLATWVDHSLIVVLEGVLAQVPPPEIAKQGLIWKATRTTKWAPAEQWGWSARAIKVINDKAYRLSVPVEVVTFLSPDVADEAASYMSKYHIQISGCLFYDFDLFCESLSWRPNVEFVIDSDAGRLQHYGIRAHQVQWGATF